MLSFIFHSGVAAAIKNKAQRSLFAEDAASSGSDALAKPVGKTGVDLVITNFEHSFVVFFSGY